MNAMWEAWDFYIALYSHENIAVRIATLGATIAMLSFLITFVLKPIWKRVKRKRARLGVEANVYQTLIQPIGVMGDMMGAGDPVLTAVITNRGDTNCFIQSISLKTSREIDGNSFFTNPKVGERFPVRLEPGEQYKKEFSISGMSQGFLNRMRGNEKVCVLVRDTTGKRYYSKKLTARSLMIQISVANNFNAKQA